jgi:hypothetical protein
MLCVDACTIRIAANPSVEFPRVAESVDLGLEYLARVICSTR